MSEEIVTEEEVLNANKNIIEKFKNMSFWGLVEEPPKVTKAGLIIG